MQNRYVGDIGDFGKYGLLRFMAQTGLVIGVNWYLTPDENHNADGKHVSYLKDKHYYGLDDDLLFKLKYVVDNGFRSVKTIQESNILQTNTLFYDVVLDMTKANMPFEKDMLRQAWHTTALEYLSSSDLIFLDPDNGLQVKSCSLTSKKGNKFIRFQELEDYYKAGKSVIFYNHRERKQEADYLNRFQFLKNGSYKGAEILGLKFSGGTVRDYIFVLQPSHYYQVKLQYEAFLKTKWNSKFSELEI